MDQLEELTHKQFRQIRSYIDETLRKHSATQIVLRQDYERKIDLKPEYEHLPRMTSIWVCDPLKGVLAVSDAKLMSLAYSYYLYPDSKLEMVSEITFTCYSNNSMNENVYSRLLLRSKFNSRHKIAGFKNDFRPKLDNYLIISKGKENLNTVLTNYSFMTWLKQVEIK